VTVFFTLEERREYNRQSKEYLQRGSVLLTGFKPYRPPLIFCSSCLHRGDRNLTPHVCSVLGSETLFEDAPWVVMGGN
jgi:hypothetical protein